jgi:hypothetical protein
MAILPSNAIVADKVRCRRQHLNQHATDVQQVWPCLFGEHPVDIAGLVAARQSIYFGVTTKKQISRQPRRKKPLLLSITIYPSARTPSKLFLSIVILKRMCVRTLNKKLCKCRRFRRPPSQLSNLLVAPPHQRSSLANRNV